MPGAIYGANRTGGAAIYAPRFGDIGPGPDPETDLTLAIKIIRNRKELNPATGMYIVYDDDGVTPILQARAWIDPAGTMPYAGGLVQRVDRLEPP